MVSTISTVERTLAPKVTIASASVSKSGAATQTMQSGTATPISKNGAATPIPEAVIPWSGPATSEMTDVHNRRLVVHPYDSSPSSGASTISDKMVEEESQPIMHRNKMPMLNLVNKPKNTNERNFVGAVSGRRISVAGLVRASDQRVQFPFPGMMMPTMFNMLRSELINPGAWLPLNQQKVVNAASENVKPEQAVVGAQPCQSKSLLPHLPLPKAPDGTEKSTDSITRPDAKGTSSAASLSMPMNIDPVMCEMYMNYASSMLFPPGLQMGMKRDENIQLESKEDGISTKRRRKGSKGAPKIKTQYQFSNSQKRNLSQMSELNGVAAARPKRREYVTGLSPLEKQKRRKEQNRVAARRSRQRKKRLKREQLEREYANVAAALQRQETESKSSRINVGGPSHPSHPDGGRSMSEGDSEIEGSQTVSDGSISLMTELAVRPTMASPSDTKE